SLRPLLGASKAGLSALVLGNGGAARAVTYVLGKLGIAHQVASRQFTSQNTLTYADLDVGMIEQHSLLINTTPLGMYPHVDQAPPLPYEALNSKHLLYDLIYNPEQTLFMR